MNSVARVQIPDSPPRTRQERFRFCRVFSLLRENTENHVATDMPQVFEGNRHEAAHEQIRKGEIDVEDARQRLLEGYSPEELDAIIQLCMPAPMETPA